MRLLIAFYRFQIPKVISSIPDDDEYGVRLCTGRRQDIFHAIPPHVLKYHDDEQKRRK